jgi:hypothetical protein
MQFVVNLRRRKQFLNEQLKEMSKNNSKLSNDFTSCVNLDDSNGTETCTDNSLKFAGSYLIQAPEHAPFSYTLQPNTHNKFNSARQSMFVPDVQSSYLRSALVNNQTLIGQHTMKAPAISARNQTLRNPLINSNDPLSHIYDTISITSANNTTCGLQRHQHQQQQHYNHLFNQNTNCPYFEIDNSITGSRKPILIPNSANSNSQANEMHLIDYFANQQHQMKRLMDNSQVATQQRAKTNLLQPVQFHSSCSPSSSSMTTSTNVITPPSIESNAMNSFRRSAFNPINASEYYENFSYLNPNQGSQHLATNPNEAVV